MKKTIPVLVLSSLLVLFACKGGDGSTPEAAAKAFFGKLASGDFEGAKKYATKESEKTLNAMIKAINFAKTMGADKMIEEQTAKYKKSKLEFVDTKTEGDNATLTMKVDGESQPVTLKKQDGAWKVDFNMGAEAEEGLEALDEINGEVKEAFDSLGKKVDINKLKDQAEQMMKDKKE